jgi:segregation and condensation protein B
MTDMTTDEAVAGLPPGVELAAALESLLIIAADPLTATDLAEATGCPVDEVAQVLDSLAIEYGAARRGFELRKVADGWRFYSAAHCAEVTGRWVTDGRQARLSQAALETLAVIAYLQPVARSRIAAIRGVGVDGVIRTLMSRGLVEESGTDPLTRASLLVTTSLFLEELGVDDLSALPGLAPMVPSPDEVLGESAG